MGVVGDRGAGRQAARLGFRSDRPVCMIPHTFRDSPDSSESESVSSRRSSRCSVRAASDDSDRDCLPGLRIHGTVCRGNKVFASGRGGPWQMPPEREPAQGPGEARTSPCNGVMIMSDRGSVGCMGDPPGPPQGLLFRTRYV
jgi:hypothetical protein